ncbi:MAG: hypothetical protein AAGF47_06070 [Planctomycetota bacterium]
MPEHRIEKTSRDDEDLLDLASEDEKSPPPALSRPPSDPELAAMNAKKLPCPTCGYELRGLQRGVCPECGTKLGFSTLSKAKAKQAGRSASAWFDRKAAVYAVLGMVAGAATWAIAEDPVVGPLAFGVDFVLTVAVGWVVFFVCSLMWIGFDQPLRMTLVQVVGAYGAFAGVWTVLGTIPFFGFFAFLISGLVLVGLLGDLLDIEYKDAFVIALISAVAKRIVEISVWSAFSMP